MEKETFGCSRFQCSDPATFLCSTHRIQFCTLHMILHIKQIQSNHKLIPISPLTLSQTDLKIIKKAQKCLSTDWQNKFTLTLPKFQSQNLDSIIQSFTKRLSQELSQKDIYLRKVKDLLQEQTQSIKKSISIYLDCFKCFINSQPKNKRWNLLYELQILKDIQIQKIVLPIPNNQIMVCTHFAKVRKKLNKNFSKNIFKSNWRKGVLFLRQQLEILYNYPQKIQQHILNNKKLSDDYLKGIIDFANQRDKQQLFSIVLMSKNNKKIKYASGKCITILNKSDFPLLNRKDLQGIQIPYSDLSKANLSFSNLKGSNLEGSIVQGANLTNTNLDFSILKDIFIQQGSRIFLDHLCSDISICENSLATGSLDSSIRIFKIPENNLIWEQENLIQFQGNNYDTKNLIEFCLFWLDFEYLNIENFPKITDFNSYRVPITRVTFSNSGRLLACGRLDGKIIVFENNEKKWEDSIFGPIFILKFSPNQKYLLGISPLGLLKVWKTESSQESFSISSRKLYDKDLIRDVCFSQNEKFLYISIYMDIFKLDLENNESEKIINSNGIIRKFDIDEQEQYIVIGGYYFNIYNIQNNKLEYQLKHQQYISSIQFIKDQSQRLLTATRNGWIFVWNFVQRKIIAKTNTNINLLREISISQNNTKIACISFLSNCVRIIDFPQNLEKQNTRDPYQSKIIKFSSNGQKLFSADTDKKIRLYNSVDGTLIRKLKGHTEKITNIFFSNEENTLLSSSNDGTIRKWNLEKKTQFILIKYQNSNILYAECSKDCSYMVLLILKENQYRIELWQTSKDICFITLKRYYYIHKVKFSPFEQLLLVWTNQAYLVLSYSQNEIQEVKNITNFPRGFIDFYILNEFQVIIFHRKQIVRQNFKENKQTFRKRLKTFVLNSADISENYAVISVDWSFIHIYDITNFELLKVLYQTIHYIKISPCQLYIVTACEQEIIKSWRLQNQQILWSTLGTSLNAQNLSINEAKIWKKDEELLRYLNHF